MKSKSKFETRIFPLSVFATLTILAVTLLMESPLAQAEGGTAPLTCEQIGGKRIPIAKKCVQAAMDAAVIYARNLPFANKYEFNLTAADQAFLDSGNYGTVCSMPRDYDTMVAFTLQVTRRDGKDAYFYLKNNGPVPPGPILEGINEIQLSLEHDLNPATCSVANDLKLVPGGVDGDSLRSYFESPNRRYITDKRLTNTVDYSVHAAPVEYAF